MNWKRFAISLFILFHLFVIGVMPNRMSYFVREAQGILTPYLNFFEFSGTWNFFAPEPGPPPLYLEWEVVGENGEDLGTGTFPETGDPFFFRDRQTRRIAIARFMHSGPDRYLKVWGRHVCQSRPDARSVRLWTVVLDVPSREGVATGRQTISPPSVADRRSVGQAFCSEFRANPEGA